MNSDRRSTLFLMEQLLAIAFFAVAAAVCVQVFVTAQLMSVDCQARSQAALLAQNLAEDYKACGGDLGRLAADNSLQLAADGLHQYYDRDWLVCQAQQASYILSLQAASVDGLPRLHQAELSVSDSTGQHLLSLSLAAREVE